MFEDESVYVNRVSAQDAKTMGEMTAPRTWDYARFRAVMINLGILGHGAAVPGMNRPDAVGIEGLRPFVDRLRRKTQEEKVEYAQTILVDREEKHLVMGKITSGTEKDVYIDTRSAPGRERQQVLIGTMHVHPGLEVSNGLSPTDYQTFLGDQREQMMLMAFGENQVLMAMKTSVTPNNLNSETVRKRLEVIEQDYLRTGTDLGMFRLVAFNKQVCAEFGLVLYANGQNGGGDTLNRVEVTK